MSGGLAAVSDPTVFLGPIGFACWAGAWQCGRSASFLVPAPRLDPHSEGGSHVVNDVLGVVVNVSVRPDKVDELVALAVRTMIEPTRSVPGCIRYELWQDRGEPERFAIIEEWESEEAQAAHLASDWLQPVIVALQPLASAPFQMQRLQRAG